MKRIPKYNKILFLLSSISKFHLFIFIYFYELLMCVQIFIHRKLLVEFRMRW